MAWMVIAEPNPNNDETNWTCLDRFGWFHNLRDSRGLQGYDFELSRHIATIVFGWRVLVSDEEIGRPPASGLLGLESKSKRAGSRES